jgi:hypothetical protein
LIVLPAILNVMALPVALSFQNAWTTGWMAANGVAESFREQHIRIANYN